MLNNRQIDMQCPRGLVPEVTSSADGRSDGSTLGDSDKWPRLHVHTVERTAVIRFVNADIIFEESAVQAVREQLHRLIEQGYTRLLVNLEGVQYLSGAALGVLSAVHRKLQEVRGRVQFCGLAPLLQDMVRITHLDRAIDVCDDEAEALGLTIRS